MQRRWILSVLGILIMVTMLTMATTAEVFLIPSLEAKRQNPSCLVTTTGGDVQGLDNGVSCSFLGIPFAAPPIGDLRWRPPQPAPPWAPATLTVTTAVAMCPQVNPAGSTTVVGIEDCLKLNVWTPDPAPASPVPVIVWIHTGAFQAASANLADSNPQKLVERTGAIVVAANYRIGPLGFMGHPALTGEDPGYRSSGNYGFLDQRAALAWVRDNIAAFGGDPGNVTIDGQSAGGHSVSLHVVSPGSAGYFHRAIMQSGYASTRWRTRADAEALGTDFAAAVGCTDPAQVLACMRSKTRNEVLLAFGNGQQEFAETGRVPWGPVVDGLDIPDQPRRMYEAGDFNHVPLIIGATRDEGWIYVDRSFPAGLTEEQYEAAVATEFGAADAPAILAQYPVADFPSPKLALSRLTGDVEMVCEARRVARLVERTRTPVYLYSFEREADAVVPDLVIHGLDRNFVFGNNFGPPSNYVLNADDLSLFGAISGYWTRFAASGNPNGDDDGTIRWPAFRHSNGTEAEPASISCWMSGSRGQAAAGRAMRFLGAVLPEVDRQRIQSGIASLPTSSAARRSRGHEAGSRSRLSGQRSHRRGRPHQDRSEWSHDRRLRHRRRDQRHRTDRCLHLRGHHQELRGGCADQHVDRDRDQTERIRRERRRHRSSGRQQREHDQAQRLQGQPEQGDHDQGHLDRSRDQGEYVHRRSRRHPRVRGRRQHHEGQPRVRKHPGRDPDQYLRDRQPRHGEHGHVESGRNRVPRERNPVRSREHRRQEHHRANTCGLKGPVSGNTVEKNLLEGNVADVCF